MPRSPSSIKLAVGALLLVTLAGCSSGNTAPTSDASSTNVGPDSGADSPDSESSVFVDAGGDGATGSTCGGSDFVSCNNIQADGTGECAEASGFGGAVQKQLFVDACDGTLSTAPCPRAVPNTGGCTQPSSFCWVVWAYQPDDPSTTENEFEEGKLAHKDACAASGGKYLSP